MALDWFRISQGACLYGLHCSPYYSMSYNAVWQKEGHIDKVSPDGSPVQQQPAKSHDQINFAID